MGRDFAETSGAAQEIFRRADDVLGFALSRICFDGPAEELERTDIQQPAIFVTSAAIWAAFLEAGGGRDQFSFAGGLSLGEYTALYVAGAMSFEDALRLVHRRGQLMQEAATAAPSGMVSLIGADEATVSDLCDKARGDGVLAAANFNCPGQIVVAGSKDACERAAGLAEAASCRAIPLAVAGAFHSPLMASAAEGLAPVLAETSFQAPVLPVISNVTANYHGDPDSIRESLRRQVVEPVRWQRCVERMIADGVERFIEIGPGRVLAGLMRKIDRKRTTINIGTAVSLAAAQPALTGETA